MQVAQRLVADDSGILFTWIRDEWLNKDVVAVWAENVFAGPPVVVPVMVNLNFPNSVLREHFDIYLQRLRLEHGRPSAARSHAPDLKEWEQIGALPCLDLLLWSKEQRRSMPESVLVSALGPDGQVDENTIRRTVRPLAASLLSPGGDAPALGRLKALAYFDASQREKIRSRSIESAPRQKTLK
jgi:hypothetical protein